MIKNIEAKRSAERTYMAMNSALRGKLIANSIARLGDRVTGLHAASSVFLVYL